MKKAMLFGLILAGMMMFTGVASAEDVWVTSRYSYSYPGTSYGYTSVTTVPSWPVTTRTYYYPRTYRRVTYGGVYPVGVRASAPAKSGGSSNLSARVSPAASRKKADEISSAPPQMRSLPVSPST